MSKATIVEIRTGFSEAPSLHERVFDSAADFDAAIVEACRNDPLTGYRKTETEIHFSNGDVERLELPASRRQTFSGLFANKLAFANSREMPGHYHSRRRWLEAKAEAKKFFEKYEI